MMAQHRATPEWTPADGVIRWLQLEDYILRESEEKPLINEIAAIHQIHGVDGYFCNLPRGFIRAFSINSVQCPNSDIFTRERYFDRPESKPGHSFEYEIFINDHYAYRGMRNQFETMLPFVRVLPVGYIDHYGQVSVQIKGNQFLHDLRAQGKLEMMVLLAPDDRSWVEPIHAHIARGPLYIPWGLMKYDLPNYLVMDDKGTNPRGLDSRYERLTFGATTTCDCWQCREKI